MYTSPSHFQVNSPKQNVPIEGIHLNDLLLTLNERKKDIRKQIMKNLI